MTNKPLELTFDVFGNSQHPPLIILHGFFASARNWRTLAKRFADKHYVFSLNLRNHGDSPSREIMDYPSMAVDVKHFMEQQHLSRINILGHSMGGKVGMWFALHYAELVDKLIIADISPSRYVHSFDRTITALMELPLTEINNRREADTFLENTLREADYRQFLLQNLQLVDGEYRWRVNLDIFFRQADNIIGFPDTDDTIPYDKPALFLGGEQSDYILAEDVYRLFPHAIIKHIPGAGHWLHAQEPELFFQEVMAFLD